MNEQPVELKDADLEAIASGKVNIGGGGWRRRAIVPMPVPMPVPVRPFGPRVIVF